MPIYAKMGVSSTGGGSTHNKLTFFKDDSFTNNNRKELKIRIQKIWIWEKPETRLTSLKGSN